MGAKKDGGAKNEGGEKITGTKKGTEKKGKDANGGGGADKIVINSSIFDVDMHCEGCAKRVARIVKRIEGVEDVVTECQSNRLKVTGSVDPSTIKETLEAKIKKKVNIVISPQKKDDDGNKEKKPNKKTPEKEQMTEKKPPKEISVALKMKIHCDGCRAKIQKIIKKFKGVVDVTFDEAKELVTVKGTMDVKEMVPYLNLKLKRNVEAIPSKEDKKKGKESNGEEEKKGTGGDNTGDEETKKKNKKENGEVTKNKKDKGGGQNKEAGSGSADVANKMEQYYGYPPPPMYHDGTLNHYNYAPQPSHGYGVQTVPCNQDTRQGVVMAHYHAYAPQMFSDENPNACVMM